MKVVLIALLKGSNMINHPSIHLSLHPSLSPSICPSLPPSICPTLPPSICPSLPPSICPSLPPSICHLIHLSIHPFFHLGAQWLSGRVLDSRPKGRGFEPQRRHCVVSWSKKIKPSLVLVQPRKTCPVITERLLMGRKESNQTNKIHSFNIFCYFAKLTLFMFSTQL